MFNQLDYLYTPSKDVAGDAKVFAEVLGGKLAFSVEGMGARVAMIELTAGRPTSCSPTTSRATARSTSTGSTT